MSERTPDDDRLDDEVAARQVRYRDYWDTGERMTVEELAESVGIDLDEEPTGQTSRD